ncbi:hypothetical protein [Flavobacterium sp. N3904]|uniref:hypothetical protein n=1 Tax=Flavobacterium sp. N3904 TaxID=2986835 RepID=UPI00222447DB|nr:hypothetical protein [Flavobacterium sp. N3904]
MKNFTKSLIALLLLSTSAIYSQQFTSRNSGTDVRLNIYGSYAFKDSFDSYYSNGNYSGQLQDGLQYGGGLEYIVGDHTGVELSYIGQTTTAPTTYYYPLTTAKVNYDVQMNYIMIGGNKYFRQAGSKFEGFGGLSIGMNIVDINNPNPSSNYTYNDQTITKFAWGVKAGGIVWVSNKVGIKMQAQLLSTSQTFGGGLYFGTGGGGATVSSYSTVYQFSLGGGLVFQLSK